MLLSISASVTVTLRALRLLRQHRVCDQLVERAAQDLVAAIGRDRLIGASSMFLISRSKSAFFTASPLTRASTSGSCAGTGLAPGQSEAGAGVAPAGVGCVVAPGWSPACWLRRAAADAVVDAAGALRQPIGAGHLARRMADRTLIKTT